MNDLVFDVGMHTGEDTAFYLAKGFRVVAVEADPGLVERARERFADAIDCGRLTIHPVAIASHQGTTTFYRNEEKSDWGTTSPAFVARNEAFGSRHTPVEVPCMPLDEIIRSSGIPYYAKIDIEGADLLCLRSFLAFDERPRYVSIETSLDDFEAFFGELSLLWLLGYRRFKTVDQRLNGSVRCPDPPLEGLYVDQRFDGHMSGPFGEEAPGSWEGVDETLARHRRILEARRSHTHPRRRWRPWRRPEPLGWYDLHAALPRETGP
ncbi:MAG: FkbM family methyltransferase [Myxococcota bacterium]